MKNKDFPHGFNWQCPLCETYASVALADLEGYICPRCKGRGLQAFKVTPKAVVVPEQKIKDTILKFKDPRFETGIKDSGRSSVGSRQSTVGGRKKKKKTRAKSTTSKIDKSESTGDLSVSDEGDN